MDLFQISNKQLSVACNVDPSLVSRWRNGTRVPSPKSDQYQAIATYFLSFHPTKQQKSFLQEIFAYQKLQSPNIDDHLELLIKWLSIHQSNELSEKQAPTPSITLSQQALPILSNELDLAVKSIGKVSSYGHERTKRSYHLFHDYPGKRKAASLLIKRALELDKPTELYISSDEGAAWWFEDPNFQVSWRSSLKQLVLKKHKIHLLHNVNRDKEDYINYLNFWIPLHLLGNTTSHYMPKYIDRPVKETHIVLKNTMAYTSYSSFLTPKENICFLYEDQETVGLFESLFLGKLVHCKPLIETYRSIDQLRFMETITNISYSDYPVVTFSAGFHTYFFPDSVFERYSGSFSKQQQTLYLRHIKQWKKSKKDAFERVPYTNLMPIELLLGVITHQTYTHYDPIFFQNTKITLTKDELIQTIKNMIFTLQRYYLFEIHLIAKSKLANQLHFNMALREHQGVVFTPNDLVESPYISLFSDEANLLNSLSHYMEKVLDEVPRNLKDKNATIKQLQNTLTQLES